MYNRNQDTEVLPQWMLEIIYQECPKVRDNILVTLAQGVPGSMLNPFSGMSVLGNL